MLMRIDHEHFLTHMIDHFTLEELMNIKFIIIGSVAGAGSQKSVQEQSKVSNVIKINEFYPKYEIQEYWTDYRDKKILKKLYYEYLEDPKFRCQPQIHDAILVLLLNHQNICLICKEGENVYMDVFVEYLQEKFSIPCIDLNKLFIEGEVDEMYLDFDEIHNKAVDLRRLAVKKHREENEITQSGRLRILNGMSKKEKVKLCREVGIDVGPGDYKNLDKLLIEGWVEEAMEE